MVEVHLAALELLEVVVLLEVLEHLEEVVHLVVVEVVEAEEELLELKLRQMTLLFPAEEVVVEEAVGLLDLKPQQ